MKKLWKILSPIVSAAVIFLIGIAIAAVAKHSTFTAEWANMIAWFSTWAK